jgi:signal transduction histidine kinase
VILTALVVLLDCYHCFLLRTLEAKVWATSGLQREIRERRNLEHSVAVVADRERQRLGRDMHDGVCQQLTAALLRCQSLERRAAAGEPLAGGDFSVLSALLGDTVEEAHNVAVGLCPLDGDPGALAAALGALASRVQLCCSVCCEFRVTGNVETPDPDTTQHLYRIAQAAVNNAVRHAQAKRIGIELHDCGAELLLVVEDDGIGLPAQTPAGGLGLRTMANRAHLLDGKLTIGAASGGGVCVSCRVLRDGAEWFAEPSDAVAPQHGHV